MIRVEFAKQTRRVRTYIGLGICIAIPAIITIAIKVGGPPESRRASAQSFFRVATHSGLNIPFAALIAMSGFMLPVVVSLFFGESVAGEAGWGTLRYLLVRPVGRARLLAAKFSIAAMLAFVATMLVALVGLGAGVAAFGWHEILTPSFTVMAPGAALVRLAIATVYITWSMAGMASFAFMLSTLTDSPVGAIAGSVGLVIVSAILDGITQLGSIRYAMPTHYWDSWVGMFVRPMQTGDMVRGVLLQVPYIAVFCGFAWWWFRRKDILS